MSFVWAIDPVVCFMLMAVCTGGFRVIDSRLFSYFTDNSCTAFSFSITFFFSSVTSLVLSDISRSKGDIYVEGEPVFSSPCSGRSHVTKCCCFCGRDDNGSILRVSAGS